MQRSPKPKTSAEQKRRASSACVLGTYDTGFPSLLEAATSYRRGSSGAASVGEGSGCSFCQQEHHHHQHHHHDRHQQQFLAVPGGGKPRRASLCTTTSAVPGAFSSRKRGSAESTLLSVPFQVRSCTCPSLLSRWRNSNVSCFPNCRGTIICHNY
jgi:hypothetical protein